MSNATPVLELWAERSTRFRRSVTAAVVSISSVLMGSGCASAPPPTPGVEIYYTIERQEVVHHLPPEDDGWRVIGEEDAVAGDAGAEPASGGRMRDRPSAKGTEPLDGGSRDDGVLSLDEADRVGTPGGVRRSNPSPERSLDEY